jgi:hypothetical protein
MSKVLSQDEGPDAAGPINCLVLAPTAMGLDIVGKLSPAQGNYTFAVVAVEYFKKMGRSKATHQRELRINQNVLLAKHHLPLWHT